jgi:hypothetical protein
MRRSTSSSPEAIDGRVSHACRRSVSATSTCLVVMPSHSRNWLPEANSGRYAIRKRPIQTTNREILL